MLALVRLGGRSRGAPIVLELEGCTEPYRSPAAVFVALRRLEQRGYARSSKRERSARRRRPRQPRVSDHVGRKGEAGRVAPDVRAAVARHGPAGGTVMSVAAATAFATTLLRWLLPEALRDDALDDLADGHALRLTLHGRRAADRWYWRQVPTFALRLRLATLTGGPFSPPPIRRTGPDRE